MKACVKTLGCKVNTYESEYMAYLLKEQGYEIVENNADVYVVNTCTVTNAADAKSRKLIRSLRRENENAIIVVTGCHTQKLTEEEKKQLDVDIVLGNKDKSKIIEYINDFKEKHEKIECIYDMSNQEFETMFLPRFEGQTRAFIKIEDGCNNFCSYCIIPYVRGRVRSKDKDELLKEINSFIESGSKEIVLTGIHTGQYESNGYKLYDLLKDIVENTELYRVRISSIEIVELNDEILDLFSKTDVIASHYHIPLQCGCDKILKLMNRRYDTKYFMERVNRIRKSKPNISLTTDVIVGFPNETDEDFEITYNFCKQVGFSKIHVFPYSDREGTVASRMSGHVNDAVKKERVKRLLELSDQLEIEFNKSLLGSEQEIIVEEFKNGYSIGHTSNFIRVLVPTELEHNKVYKVRLLSLEGNSVIAEVI